MKLDKVSLQLTPEEIKEEEREYFWEKAVAKHHVSNQVIHKYQKCYS